MKKEVAIRSLEQQKNKIIEGMKPEVWIDTTSELLRKIFPISGESKSKHIAEIYFYPFYERNQYLIDQQIQKGRLEAEKYMQEFINEINVAGIEKLNDDNQILQLFKNLYFWIVLTTFISGSFFLGNHFGISKFDNEKVNLYESKQKLNSELNKAKIMIEFQKQSIMEKDKMINSLKTKKRK